MTANFSGIWTADLSQSKFHSPGPTSLTAGPAALTVKIEHSSPTLWEEIIVGTPAGGERRSIFQCNIGEERGNAVWDGEPVRGGARWEGEELLIELWVDAGGRELHFCDYWSLTDDGQVLIMEHRNDHLDGQRTVLRKSE